ncbi:putative RNA-directed DNA polymerase from transposon X-element [Trichonephila clavipes]|nr:putative RNA-directed DNA polymerase from transposon X-element [Trichonephila clavipes]
MNRCPDLVVCLNRDLQCLRPEASLVLIYRPNVAGMKGRVDLAQPVKRTPDLWCGSTRHYHSILFENFINDLPDLLASDGLTNTALFADDLAIWCSTPKRDQSKLNTILNLTLERLHLWCIENNMTVNLKKTTCQFFTLNRQPFSPQ